MKNSHLNKTLQYINYMIEGGQRLMNRNQKRHVTARRRITLDAGASRGMAVKQKKGHTITKVFSKVVVTCAIIGQTLFNGEWSRCGCKEAH